MKISYRWVLGVAALAAAFAPGAWAQGCVLCYTSLAAGGPAAMHAFQMAMFALLIPALLLFVGLILLIFRRARTKAPVSGTPKNRPSRWPFASNPNPLEGRI